MDRQMDIEDETIGNKWFQEWTDILLNWDDGHEVYKHLCCNTTLTILYAYYPYEFLDCEYDNFRGLLKDEWI